MRVFRMLGLATVGVALACDGGAPVDPDGLALSAGGGGKQEAKASGVFLFLGGSLGDIPTDLDLKAKVKDDGTVSGTFRQTLTVLGFLIDVAGEVTCVSFDHDEGRAWIGGVVTENNSEAFFTGEIHQPGRDVWFRVLDDDENGDRSTLPGFEGGGGIITSEEYCDAQIWPDGNARTHAMIEGRIKVQDVP